MTTRVSARAIGLLALVAVPAATAGAGVIEPIGPFPGEFSEGFETFALGEGPDLDTFMRISAGGKPQGSVSGVFVNFSSTFMGSQVLAHSGVHFAHATNPVEFTFLEPVHRFGGWMATNGGADGGLVEFFDAGNQLVGTAPLDVTFQPGVAPYTWNGWEITEPVSRIRVSGNGALEGFLGFDDLEMSQTPPEPSLVEPIGPFEGDLAEDFEALAGGFGDVEIFFSQDGEANGTIGFVSVISSLIFGGNQIVPHGGLLFASVTTNPIELQFLAPVHRFGGWVATNSGQSGGLVEFFDVEDQLVATAPLDVTFVPGVAPYTWNGWEFSVPISRIRMSSNGLAMGFLGVDDLQLAFPPGEPDCPWDFDGDGAVTLADYLEALEHIGGCPKVGPCPWDVDGNGRVDRFDVFDLLANMGPCPGAQ